MELASRRIGERWGCLYPYWTVTVALVLVPMLLRWVPLWYFALELCILVGAGFAGTAYIVRLVRDVKKRHLLEWTSDLRRLDADEFEWLIHELFEREGYQVTKVGSQSAGDGNIDLIMERGSERVIVQCKRWQSRYVDPAEIQRFAGTYAARGNVSGRVFVTLSDYTAGAREAARRAGITLVDGRELIDRIEKVRRIEACPVCGTGMVLAKSVHGWWLRCPRYTEGCPGKRDLSHEPGRAVELLLAER